MITEYNTGEDNIEIEVRRIAGAFCFSHLS
jgi:hypothetical protein